MATVSDAPVRDRRIEFAAPVVLHVVASVAMILRLTSRFWSPGARLWKDDIVVLLFFVRLPHFPLPVNGTVLNRHKIVTSAILGLCLELGT